MYACGFISAKDQNNRKPSSSESSSESSTIDTTHQNIDPTEERFIEILRHDYAPLMLLPGGVYEFSSPNRDRKVEWKKVAGFARVLVNERNRNRVEKEKEKQNQTTKNNNDSPIIPSTIPSTIPAPAFSPIQVIPYYTRNCESIWWSNKSWTAWSGTMTRYLHNRIREGNLLLVPPFFMIAISSLGFTLLPRPVKLDTYFGEPLVLLQDETATDFTARVRKALQTLIDHTDNLPERPFKQSTLGSVEEPTIVKGYILPLFSPLYTLYTTLYTILYGLFTLCQNVVLQTFTVGVLIAVVCPVLLVNKAVVRPLFCSKKGGKKGKSIVNEKKMK